MTYLTRSNWRPTTPPTVRWTPVKRSHSRSLIMKFLVTRRRLNEPPKSDISSTERYMRGAVHANTLYKIMQRPGWTLEEVEEWMQVWLDALISAEIEPLRTPENWPSSDTCLPQNYLDAIPRNLIITEAGFHEFFDLEWDIGCSVPLSLVLYRGLLITLTGVRSIACPSDNRMRERESLFSALMQYSGYSLSTAHQHVFNKVMTDLSETASGIIKTESPSTERKAMPAFHVRPLSPAQEHEERAQLAVYFEEEFRGFDESDKVQIDFAGGGGRNSNYS